MHRKRYLSLILIIHFFTTPSHLDTVSADNHDVVAIDYTPFYVNELERKTCNGAQVDSIDLLGTDVWGNPESIRLQRFDTFSVRYVNPGGIYGVEVGNTTENLFPEEQSYTMRASGLKNWVVSIEFGEKAFHFLESFDLSGFVANISALEELIDPLEPYSSPLDNHGTQFRSLGDEIGIGYYYENLNTSIGQKYRLESIYDRSTGLLSEYTIRNHAKCAENEVAGEEFFYLVMTRNPYPLQTSTIDQFKISFNFFLTILGFGVLILRKHIKKP